jgi:hypothetical protein
MNNTIHSTLTDLLDRCSAPSFDNDIHLCLNDLCQRVVFIVDQLPSPIFKRKMPVQTTKEVTHVEEESQRKQSITDHTPNVTSATEKKEESMEQELSDVKSTGSISNVIATQTSHYICEWDNCRA